LRVREEGRRPSLREREPRGENLGRSPRLWTGEEESVSRRRNGIRELGSKTICDFVPPAGREAGWAG